MNRRERTRPPEACQAPRRGGWNRRRTHVCSTVNIPLLAVCQFVTRMATGVGSAADRFAGGTRRSMRFIVAAASSGTIIEWYDFYIFVTLGFILTPLLDRKSTRLNSSHSQISYAVFCLK